MVIHKSLRDFRPLRCSSRDSQVPANTRCNACSQELDYRIDICHVTKGAHIEHLKGRTETWSVSLSVDILPFGVTIPATAPQGSEIPDGLMNNPVCIYIYIYIRLRKWLKTKCLCLSHKPLLIIWCKCTFNSNKQPTWRTVSFIYIYFDSLHVSSNLVLIISRFICINTTSGLCHSV
jgi:hypothetical protein